MFKREGSNPFEDEITLDDLERFSAIHGRGGKRILTFLGKQKEFVSALSSNVGKQVLHDTMVMMEDLLEKIILQKATKQEVLEYKTLRKIFNRWVSRITILEKGKKTIKEEVKKIWQKKMNK